MREHVINRWCDMCYDDDEQKVPAVDTWTIGIGLNTSGAPPLHVLETCEMHGKTLGEIRDRALTAPTPGQIGAGPMPTPKPIARAAVSAPVPLAEGIDADGELTGGAFACPVCERAHISRNSQINHVWREHAASPRPPAPQGKCPECNKRFATPSALGTHRVVHGYDQLEQALAAVPDNRP